MKNIKIFMTMIFWLVSVPILQTQSLEQPRKNLAAWNNQIESAEFSHVGERTYSLTLYSAKSPICIVAPTTFQESLDPNKKRYVLPRTMWSPHAMQKFMHQYEDQIKVLGIDLEIYKIPRPHFGIGVFFKIDSSVVEIEKQIDNNEKFIRFVMRIKK